MITQHCYSEPELQAAGVRDIATHDGGSEFGMTGDSGRMFFLATRAWRSRPHKTQAPPLG
jgi:hypothetical protein